MYASAAAAAHKASAQPSKRDGSPKGKLAGHWMPGQQAGGQAGSEAGGEPMVGGG